MLLQKAKLYRFLFLALAFSSSLQAQNLKKFFNNCINALGYTLPNVRQFRETVFDEKTPLESNLILMLHDPLLLLEESISPTDFLERNRDPELRTHYDKIGAHFIRTQQDLSINQSLSIRSIILIEQSPDFQKYLSSKGIELDADDYEIFSRLKTRLENIASYHNYEDLSIFNAIKDLNIQLLEKYPPEKVRKVFQAYAHSIQYSDQENKRQSPFDLYLLSGNGKQPSLNEGEKVSDGKRTYIVKKHLGMGGEHNVYLLSSEDTKTDIILKIGGYESAWHKEKGVRAAGRLGIKITKFFPLTEKIYFAEPVLMTGNTILQNYFSTGSQKTEAEGLIDFAVDVREKLRTSSLYLGDINTDNMGLMADGTYAITDPYPIVEDRRAPYSYIASEINKQGGFIYDHYLSFSKYFNQLVVEASEKAKSKEELLEILSRAESIVKKYDQFDQSRDSNSTDKTNPFEKVYAKIQSIRAGPDSFLEELED